MKRFLIKRDFWFKASAALNGHIKKSWHAKKEKQIQLLIKTFLSQLQACFVLREGKKIPNLADPPQKTPTIELSFGLNQSTMFFPANMNAITTKQMPVFSSA